MFPFVFRVLTIAAVALLAGTLTKAYLRRKDENDRYSNLFSADEELVDVEAKEVPNLVKEKEENKVKVESKPDINFEQAREKANRIIKSSERVLSTYKNTDDLKVDLSLARFSLESAQRLYSENQYDEAWEKASVVGVLIGIAEIRASIDKEMSKQSNKQSEEIESVKKLLAEADSQLAEASKSFVFAMEASFDFAKVIQKAFQLTAQAQQGLLK